jgi:hypothetical protein
VASSDISSPIFPRIFTTRYWSVTTIWAVMAAINISAGIVIASWPERQADLSLMRVWTSEWLLAASNVYAGTAAHNYPDYPPHAIVAFSPIALIPADWLVPAWATLNIGLAVFAAHLAVRSVRPLMTFTASAFPIFMLLTWGGFRTLLQFTLFSVTFGLLSTVLSDKRPTLSGVCLAMALTKPQVGLPFLLWALFTRRVRSIALSLATITAIFAVYCMRVHANPMHVVVRYFDTLWTIYSGDTVLIGLAQLRPLLAILFSFSLMDTLAVALGLLMFAVVLIVGFAEGKTRPYLIYSAPALAALWSLLTFYHLTYGFIMLLPAATLLMFGDDARSPTLRKILFWLLQIGSTFPAFGGAYELPSRCPSR